MKNWKLIRMIVNIVLFLTAATCFTFAGIKTANCIKYGRETNECTEQINQIMFDNLTEFNKPGTESYIAIQNLSAERDEANANYVKWEKGLMALSITGFLSTFALVFLLVNYVKSEK